MPNESPLAPRAEAGRVRRPTRFRTASGAIYEVRPARAMPPRDDPANPRHEPARVPRYRRGRHPRLWLWIESAAVPDAARGRWLPVEDARVRPDRTLYVAFHRESVARWTHRAYIGAALPRYVHTSRVVGAARA